MLILIYNDPFVQMISKQLRELLFICKRNYYLFVLVRRSLVDRKSRKMKVSCVSRFKILS